MTSTQSSKQDNTLDLSQQSQNNETANQNQDASTQNNQDWSFATQELLDSLPRVWTRGLLYFIVIFVSIALPWAALSKIDVTGKARGKLEPKGETADLDSPVTGTVASIKTEEGESVEKGEVLVTLKSELAKAELEQLQRKLEGQRDRLNQLKLRKSQLALAVSTQKQQNRSQALEKKAQIEQTRQKLETLKLVRNLQKQERQAQLNQARETLSSSQSALTSAKISAQGSQERLKRFKKAFESDVISKDRYLRVQTQAKKNAEQVKKAKAEVDKAQLRVEELQNNYKKALQQQESKIQKAKLQLQEQKSNYQSLKQSGKLSVLETQRQVNNLETQITALKADISQNQSRIESLQYKLKRHTIKAPRSGVVFNLAVQQQGAVLQTGSDIAEIAPKDPNLILNAEMATAESGSLKVGMPVKIKFDAYPYKDYGLGKGKVTDISPTSETQKTPQGEATVYDISVSLDKDCLPSGNRCIPLRPGNTATAEVVVRQRHIIDFVLDPFKKLQKGGFKL